eukprot:scaffold285825_cov22-Tisochrysis_lutea.AAC.1
MKESRMPTAEAPCILFTKSSCSQCRLARAKLGNKACSEQGPAWREFDCQKVPPPCLICPAWLLGPTLTSTDGSEPPVFLFIVFSARMCPPNSVGRDRPTPLEGRQHLKWLIELLHVIGLP